MKRLSRLQQFLTPNSLAVTAAIAVTAVAGIITLGLSDAATNSAASEAETGTLAGAASKVDDRAASGSSAVKFGTGGPAVANAIVISPTSSDSAAGTAAAPFKTFEKAKSIATAGSTVYFREGTYKTKIYADKSGEPGRPITYSSYPGETAIIDGETSSFDGDGLFFVDSVHDVVVQNLTIRNVAGYGQGLKVMDSTNITVSNNLIYNIWLGGLVLSGQNITAQDNEVRDVCQINFEGRNARTGTSPSAVSAEKTRSGQISKNINFINNYSHDNWGEGINEWMVDGGRVENNRSIDNYSVNIYIDDSKNISVLNNLVEQTSHYHDRVEGGGTSTGMAINSETGTQRPTNIIVNGNTAKGVLGAGIMNFMNYGPITQGPIPQNF